MLGEVSQSDEIIHALPFEERMKTLCQQRQQHALQRELTTITARKGVYLHCAGRWLFDFSSNDYLGLSQHPEILAATQSAVSVYGLGASASQVISGYYQAHADLAQAIADWLGYDKGLVFGSGYLANLAVQQAFLTHSEDTCIQDRLNHASLIDASRLAGCRLRRYQHADLDSAHKMLSQHPANERLLVTDGVFSMDGDIAPIRQLCQLAQQHNALVYVDDAHGFGVVGDDGRGCVRTQQLDCRHVPMQLVTLSKAFGSYGAVVVGTTPFIDHLAQMARSHLYSTALPPALAVAALVSLKCIRQDHWRRQNLRHNISLFRELAQQRGIALIDSTTAIQGVICHENQTALDWSNALKQKGFFVQAIRPPTVPKGTARLRIILTAAHTSQHIRLLIDALSPLVQCDKTNEQMLV